MMRALKKLSFLLLIFSLITASAQADTQGVRFSGRTSNGASGSSSPIISPLTTKYTPTIAGFGDSITAFANDCTAATRCTNENAGVIPWLNFLTGHAYNYPVNFAGGVSNGMNFGVGGQDSTQIVARVGTVVSAKPDAVLVIMGTNDLTETSTTAATMESNMNTTYQTLSAAGIRVIAMPTPPRTVWGSLTSPQIAVAQLKQANVNNWLVHYNETTTGYKIEVADPRKYWIDATDATGAPVSGIVNTVDGIHLTAAGDYYAAKAVIEAEQSAGNIPFTPAYAFVSQADAYDATNNTTGNLLAHGLMDGTSGTASTPDTGNVATGWTLERSTGTDMTCAATKGNTALDGTPGTDQHIVCTTTGAGSNTEQHYFRQFITTNFTAATDVVYGDCKGAVSGQTGNNLIGVFMEVDSSGGASTKYVDMDEYDNTRLLPVVPYAGEFHTQTEPIPTGTTSVRTYIKIDMDATKAGTVTVDVGNCSLRKTM